MRGCAFEIADHDTFCCYVAGDWGELAATLDLIDGRVRQGAEINIIIDNCPLTLTIHNSSASYIRDVDEESFVRFCGCIAIHQHTECIG